MSSKIFACVAAFSLLLSTGHARAEPPPGAPAAVPPGYAPPRGYAPPPGYAPYPYPAPGWDSPPAEYPPYTPMKRRSSGMIAVGTVLISLASVGIIAGPAMFVAGNHTIETFPPCPIDVACGPVFTGGDSALKAGGIATIVLGLAALGAGIPLLAIGAQKVPDNSEEARLLPEVLVGPGGASLAWHL